MRYTLPNHSSCTNLIFLNTMKSTGPTSRSCEFGVAGGKMFYSCVKYVIKEVRSNNLHYVKIFSKHCNSVTKTPLQWQNGSEIWLGIWFTLYWSFTNLKWSNIRLSDFLLLQLKLYKISTGSFTNLNIII